MKIYAPLTSEPLPELQEVEVATFFQIPGLQIIGLPSPEVAEAKDRIRSAIESSELQLPKRRVVLNLSPAFLRKRGTGSELAMALAILFEKREIPPVAAWGELGLDGSVKSAGQSVRAVYAVWKQGIRYFLLANADYKVASEALIWVQKGAGFLTPAPILIPVKNLREAWNWVSSKFKGLEKQEISNRSQFAPAPFPSESFPPAQLEGLLPLSSSMERLIGVIASGRHHFLCLGPKGVGKSHSLEWLQAIFPPVDVKERLEQLLMLELIQRPSRGDPEVTPEDCTQRCHQTEKQPSEFLAQEIPMRRVGTQVRAPALIGGRSSGTLGSALSWLRPGEFSLAHGGILIADEIPEWSRDSREALREPLERGVVTLTRVQGAIELPARFTLAAVGNFCPCGGWPPELISDMGPRGLKKGESRGVQTSVCVCPISIRKRYFSRLSGPVLDRLDLVLIFDPSHQKSWNAERISPSLVKENLIRLRETVLNVQEQMKKHWGKSPGLLTGAELERLLEEYPAWTDFLSEYAHASLRSRHKMLRVAMSLAAWDGKTSPENEHFAEAYCYRSERVQFLE